MTTALLPRDDPAAIQNLISAMREESRERRTIMDMCEQVLYNQHSIPVPKDLPEGESPVEVKTGLGYAQVGLLKGIFEGRPKVRVVPLDETLSAHEAAERVENYLQNVYQALEAQQGQVFSKMFMDVCVYGFGARYLAAVPKWLDIASKKAEASLKRSEKSKPGEYARYREDEMRRLSLPDSHLPYVYRHIPSRQIMWRESRDMPGGGLEVVVEMQKRHVSSILSNPLYNENMPHHLWR